MPRRTGDFIKFLAEIYMLKRNTREGWHVAGVLPDSLADHVAITAQLAFLLGELEGLSGERCAAIALFHDNGEARIGDHHKIAKRYLDKTDGELAALTDQLRTLPKNLAEKIGELVQQHEHADTPEGRIAKDADTLEFALQAKIHAEAGNVQAARMFARQAKYFKTKAAKDIYDRVAAMDDFANCWNWKLFEK
ncbi:MAG: HD domain protein [Parcubacteria group bacterium Gr01-1014_31]|nr:MAG: HD domain protein [Parcubacteria group bacterium Gr01-1014_31]